MQKIMKKAIEAIKAAAAALVPMVKKAMKVIALSCMAAGKIIVTLCKSAVKDAGASSVPGVKITLAFFLGALTFVVILGIIETFVFLKFFIVPVIIMIAIICICMLRLTADKSEEGK